MESIKCFWRDEFSTGLFYRYFGGAKNYAYFSSIAYFVCTGARLDKSLRGKNESPQSKRFHLPINQSAGGSQFSREILIAPFPGKVAVFVSFWEMNAEKENGIYRLKKTMHLQFLEADATSHHHYGCW